MKKPVVVGIGELLWDIFPGRKRLGGAPVNFVCHCNQLGAEAFPVSCVGTDGDGAEIRDALRKLGVDDRYVAEDGHHRTGAVQVTLDAQGKPSYEICEDVAWDWIPFSEHLPPLAARLDAVCFGSLAQRDTRSRETIHRFLSRVPAEALRIFDVNLRQSYFSKDVIEESLRQANVLKLSDEELSVLAGMFGLSGHEEDCLSALLKLFDLRLVAFTRGGKGSLLLARGGSDDHPGYPTAVVDSVGAGDSFTAALCVGLLKGEALSRINQQANRIASYVCSRDGATPKLTDELKKGL